MKKVLLLLGIFFAFWANIAHGQAIARAVEKAFITQASNEVISVLQRDGKYMDAAIKNNIPDGIYFDYNTTKARELIKKYPEFISLEIAINKKETYILDLVSSAKAFESMVVSTGSGKKFDLSKFKAAHYRGVVRGQEDHTLVSISLFENEISGLIYNGTENLTLGKIKGSKKHILYKDDSREKDGEPTCGMADPPLNDEEAHIYDAALNATFNGMINKCVELYFETEYDIYQAQGNSVNGVVTWVTNLFNNVSTLYANELIQTTISEIKVWDVADPYNATSSSALLNQFQAQINTLNGHLGQLLTTRSIGGGIAAGFNGLCNSNPDNSLSVSGHLTNSYPGVPTYSWNVQVVTHEFGHLFGSRHTHACVWNGNNTAIDGCAGGTEGGCPLPGIPSGGGTIMSYCHIVSGVGINFNNGFGPQPGNVIRMRVQNANCISTCCDEDQSPNFTVDIDCNNSWSVTATPVDPSAPNHWWGLYQTTVQGATSGGTLVATQNGTTAYFTWLDMSKAYYIVHRIWAECYAIKEARVAVPIFTNASVNYHFEDKNGVTKDQFCVGEDIYLDPTGTSNYDRFFMAIRRRPIGSSGPFTLYANYGTTFTNNIGLLNLSYLFKYSGDDPGEVFEPGYEYELQFAIQNIPNCIAWFELKKRFTVTCCNNFISAEFNLDMIDNGPNFSLVAHGFEGYGVNVTHEWTVLSSPNPDGGPYTVVLETTTTGEGPIVLYNQAVSGLYYFVVHKVSTLCGDFCFGKRRQGDNGFTAGGGENGPCTLCGPIDCSLLEQLCEAPQNEVAYCTSFPSQGVTFAWNPVQGATQYKVIVNENDPACCHTGIPGTSYIYSTTNTQLSVAGLARSCFSWKVGVVCNEQTIWTEYHCFRGCDAVEGQLGLGEAAANGATIAETPKPRIYPNPANAELNIALPTDSKAGLVKIIDLQGKVMFEQRNPAQFLKVDSSQFIAGMYAVQVIYEDGSQSVKHIVITH